MNNKGFAVSGIIYTLMVLFIILVIALLSMFNDRKKILDKLKDNVIDNISTQIDYTPASYNPKNSSDLEKDEFYTYEIKIKGYYELKLISSNGSILKSELYLKEGEKLYLKVGSRTYNNGRSEIYTNKDDNKSLIMQITNSNNFIKDSYNNRLFLKTNYTKNSLVLGDGSIVITYATTEKKNTDLNKVRYIKDCVHSNSSSELNEWSEIKAILNGENRALNKNITGDAVDPKLIVDGDIKTITGSNKIGESCVIVDLERTYNLDYISTWHNYSDNRIYYNREVSVSADGLNYKIIDNYEQQENENGLQISAYEINKTMLVGKIYLPIKKYEGATWMRIFHHNNMDGTILWDAKAQVLSANGYDTLHKKSALYYLNDFISSSNKYELLLEYPDIDKNKYNRWTQTSDFTINENDFTSISAPFNGLKLNGTNSIISGSTGWYYSIGALTNIDNGILGYGNTINGTVDLWIRIDEYLK